MPRSLASKKIGFLFHMGHGHRTQFFNLAESLTLEEASHTQWMPIHGSLSHSRLANNLPLPRQWRYRLHQRRNIRDGVETNAQWDALFYACGSTGLLPYMHRYRCYLYVDLSPSLKRELAPWYDHQLRGGTVINKIRDTRQRRLAQGAQGIFTMSEWAARGFGRDYDVPLENLHVVLPGANLKRWHYVDRSDRSRHRPLRILMVGGQFKLKGGPLLLEWAARTSFTNWELDIVTWPGELPPEVRARLGHRGPDERVSVAISEDRPHIRVHCGMSANSPELIALFEQADVFCLPTQADGSSIASLEAMASGLPILVSGVGGIPELVQDNHTGLLLKRGSLEDLTNKLETVLCDANLRLQLGRNARAACEDHLNTERQMQEILAVMYRESGSVPRSS